VGRHRTAVESLADPQLEVVGTLTEAHFLAEIERCYSCGQCMGCASCWMYCTVGSFIAIGGSSPGEYFEMVLDACEECGKCVEVCPAGYLEAIF
ncbi:MAG: hypothetical protein KJO17_00310, partial [Acidimicrobiia bacterium]|nr:hypothetical protein [Acidimicrobiia bacterium]